MFSHLPNSAHLSTGDVMAGKVEYLGCGKLKLIYVAVTSRNRMLFLSINFVHAFLDFKPS